MRLLARILFYSSFVWVMSVDKSAAENIFRCEGKQGEAIFQDKPCYRSGYGEWSSTNSKSLNAAVTDSSKARFCRFDLAPVTMADPALDKVEARLHIWVDSEGPGIAIVVSGEYLLASGRHNAVLKFDIGQQGIKFSDDRFFEADFLHAERLLGFGRSRAQTILAAALLADVSLVIWFSDYAQPVETSAVSSKLVRASLDNADRCWKLRGQ